MWKINIKFLTDKGVNAYSAISSKQQTWQEKLILKKIFREVILSKAPLEIDIMIKIPRLAILIELPEKIKEGMEQYGARENIDYMVIVE